jgi:hypothetical protein
VSAELDAIVSAPFPDDASGADAALLLFETDHFSAGTARKYVDDARDSFQALGTRTLVERDDARRRQRFVAPSARVRLAAFRAAAEAEAAADLPALAEAVLKEPSPQARTAALRAFMAGSKRGEDAPRAVALLRELLGSGSAADVAFGEDAYAYLAQPPFLEAGGRELLESSFAKVSPATLAGALALLRGGAAPPTLRAKAEAHVLRGLNNGTEREQRFVYAAAPKPLAPALLRAAQKVAYCTDMGCSRTMAVAALEALMDTPGEREHAQEFLTAYAKPADLTDVASAAARAALARHHVANVQAWVELDLHGDRSAKVSAAYSLASLDRASRAAPLLADTDRVVRLATACAILK